LENLIKNTSIQSINEINNLAWSLNREDTVKAIELANKALNDSETFNYKLGIALAKKTLGACHVWISKNDLAIEYCFDAITLFQDLNDKKNEVDTLHTLGSNFFYLSDYDTSIKYYQKSYDLSTEIDYALGMADGLNGMGSIYYTIEQNEDALNVLTKCEKICRENNFNTILVKLLDGLGDTYFNLKDYEKALIYYNDCLNIIKEISGNLRVRANALDGIGRAFTELNEFDKAIISFNDSLRIRRETDFKFGEALTLNNLGKLYIKKNQLNNAVIYLTEAYDLSIKISSKEGIYQSSEKLAELFEKQSNPSEALKFYKIFHSAKEEVRNQKSTQLSKSFELQNKVLQSQAEKVILEERAKELENFSDSLILMRDVGQKIISNLSVATIVNTVYKSVNELMDATGFGIGLYYKESNSIIYPLYIEGEDRYENIKYDLNDEDRLTSLCFKQDIEIIINDFETEISQFLNKNSTPKAGKQVESIIYLPLKFKDVLLGVITVQSFNKNAYNNFHLNIFKNLATYTAIALENAKLYEEQEHKVKERTFELIKSKEEIEKSYEINKKLNEIGREITSSLNLGEIFKKLHESISEIMPADCFGVRTYNSETKSVTYKYEIENGILTQDVATIPLDDINNYTVWCTINKQDIFLNDNLKEYKKYVNQIKVVSGDMPDSLLFTPMMLGEKILGVITVQSFNKNAYLPHHIEILRTLGTYTAIALENAYLYENMEEKVKLRTQEVVKQKEEIEKTFENTRLISEIGKEISSTFSIEEIISKVYKSINRLMDATMFGIGIYDFENKQIKFKGAIEEGRILSDYYYELNETLRPAVLSFVNQTDYVISNFTEEFLANNKVQPRSSLPGNNTESIIYTPLTQNNKKIGVITVQSYQVNAYNDYHLQLLKSLSIYTAIALDNASLYNNLELRVNERTKEIQTAYENTRLLSQIAEDISSSLSVEVITSKVYENVNKLMDATIFGIGLFNPQNKKLEFKGFMENNQLMPEFSFVSNDPNRLASQCFSNKHEIFINDYLLEYKKYISGIQAPVSGLNAASIIYIPIYSKNIVIGVLTVQSFEKYAYSEYQFNILKTLAVSVGIALDNANLYHNLEEKVEERTAEVIKQKAIIEEKNKDITDSIKYAKKIQQAIAPNIDEFNKNFTDSFILYKPKDIVSGDFYWFEHFNENVTVFAAADCTGHGVPGAFMSLICSEIMYKVINDNKEINPANALKLIDEKLIQLIKKSSESSSNDGMDIALCSYSKQTNMLSYAGAHRSLLVIRNNEINEYKPSKFSIGGHSTEGKFFELHQIKVFPGDLIYLLTDGYADQFGGEKGKKFKFKNLKELILKVSSQSMSEQKDNIDKAFETWKGNLEQVDDVCIIGVKI